MPSHAEQTYDLLHPIDVSTEEPYTPLIWPPFDNGDSITQPYMVGNVVFGPGNDYAPVDPRNLPLFVAKTDLSDRPTDASNDGGKGVGTVSGSPHISDISALWEIQGKYKRFVPVALAFAAMSKMPGTNVGCVILGWGKVVLSSGWNGAARGSRADQDDRLDTRESRLTWVVHAEANAIANAARSGTSLLGSTLVCTLMPCMNCAKLIVQAGIVTVLCPAPTAADARWQSEFDLTRRLFDECGVHIHHYEKDAQ